MIDFPISRTPEKSLQPVAGVTGMFTLVIPRVHIGEEAFQLLKSSIREGRAIAPEIIKVIEATFSGARPDTEQLVSLKELRETAMVGAAYWKANSAKLPLGEPTSGYERLTTALTGLILAAEPSPATYFFRSQQSYSPRSAVQRFLPFKTRAEE